MAKIKHNHVIMSGIHGKVGDWVVRQMPYGPVLSKRPDMSKVVRTQLQNDQANKFQRGVEYAKGIIADPLLKEEFRKKIKRGRSVYHAAIGEYMKNH